MAGRLAQSALVDRGSYQPLFTPTCTPKPNPAQKHHYCAPSAAYALAADVDGRWHRYENHHGTVLLRQYLKPNLSTCCLLQPTNVQPLSPVCCCVRHCSLHAPPVQQTSMVSQGSKARAQTSTHSTQTHTRGGIRSQQQELLPLTAATDSDKGLCTGATRPTRTLAQSCAATVLHSEHISPWQIQVLKQYGSRVKPCCASGS
jgi:hypothetical protein